MKNEATFNGKNYSVIDGILFEHTKDGLFEPIEVTPQMKAFFEPLGYSGLIRENCEPDSRQIKDEPFTPVDRFSSSRVPKIGLKR